MMRHPASRALWAYWQDCCRESYAPERAHFDPGAIRSLLADSFVIGADTQSIPVFRVTGTRLCALFGRDLKSSRFIDLWREDQQAIDAIEACLADAFGMVIGASATDAKGIIVPVEVIILPFRRTLAMPVSATGLIVPLSTPDKLTLPLSRLAATSWRSLAYERAPRIMSRGGRQGQPAIAGTTLYEAARPVRNHA